MEPQYTAVAGQAESLVRAAARELIGPANQIIGAGA